MHLDAQATNRRVDQHLHQFAIRAQRDGADAARNEALAQLAAITVWFDRQYGARRTYEVFQEIADHLIAGSLPPNPPDSPGPRPRW